MSCPCCREKAALRARIAELEAGIKSADFSLSDGGITIVSQAFSLSTSQAIVLMALYRATGLNLSADRLHAALGLNATSASREDRSDVIRQQVKRIRKRMGGETIESAPWKGFRLSDEARARIGQVLGAAA